MNEMENRLALKETYGILQTKHFLFFFLNYNCLFFKKVIEFLDEVIIYLRTG